MNSHYPKQHKLDNGWIVKERIHQSKKAFIETPAGHSDALAKFEMLVLRCPAVKEVRVIHLLSTTAEEQRKNVDTAIKHIAVPRCRYLTGHWRRYKGSPWLQGSYGYRVYVGRLINEEKEFLRLANSIEITNDADHQMYEFLIKGNSND